MNDLISRQAAIDALAKFVPYAICDESTESYTNGLTDAYNLICQLPSAQPKRTEKRTETHACDCISRQAAIDALDKRFDSIPMEQTTEILLLRKDLRNLPSAQPQRMRGKWTYGEDEYGIDGYHCDKCGFFVPWDYTHKFINFIKDYHFCPNCGARMDESETYSTGHNENETVVTE